ncbi:MAG: hypothetical protein IPG99_02465 [Ignavibacteria bacterium]|nr:hypothetical protein [Ignavibacteria bacterium]
MDNTTDFHDLGDAAGDQFGFPVSNAGDINGDGYSDSLRGQLEMMPVDQMPEEPILYLKFHDRY